MNQERNVVSSEFNQNNFDISTYTTVEKLDVPDQSIIYPDSSFYLSSMTTTQISPSSSFYYDSQQHSYQQQQQQQSQFIQQSNTTAESSNFASISSPSIQQQQLSGKISTCSPSSIMMQDSPMLVASSSTTTTASTMSSSSVELLNEAFAKATSLPEAFYPEFLQYSKETYEQSTGSGPHRKKQKREFDIKPDLIISTNKSKQKQQRNEKESPVLENEEDASTSNLTSEIRRQIHIQSEQKRRAQIKDGFEELRNELPTCLNKKMSKVVLLHRTVQHIQHLKDTQASILSELERLVQENEQLRKFQENVLQKQALENMYTMSNI
ncbi:MAG: hypothetical protein EXX96DRAFT_549512 [Benjaminiella poitrasii]|nr:MAG: hypothetical protein EXX96DRAFT_549512 [Benjaminiella poitrasii]